MSNEKRTNLWWWAAMAVFLSLLIFLNYKHLPGLLTELATQGLTIVAWILWVNVLMKAYAFFFAHRRLSGWGYIALGGAAGCSLLMWIINDSFAEVLGVLYFALIAAAVTLVVFHSKDKR